MFWPSRRKTNRMADADSNPEQVPAVPSPIENIMNLLGFVKINFTNVPYAEMGTIVLGVDEDGKLKFKDEYGNIFEFLYT